MTQVSKRLDERFTWAATDRLLSNLREFTSAVELRLTAGDQKDTAVDSVITEIKSLALTRLNEILLPAAQRIQALTSLGFLIAKSATMVSLAIGPRTFIVTAGDQRDLFTPSPFVAIEAAGDLSVRGVGKVLVWDKETGTLALDVVAADGSTNLRSDWVISSTAGVSEAVRQDMNKASLAAAAAANSAASILGAVASTSADRDATHADRLLADSSAQVAALAAGSAVGVTTSQTMTRAQVADTVVPAPIRAFRLVGNTAVGDGGNGAPYIEGTAAGPRAVKDKANRWFQLDTSAGIVDAAWCGVVANVDTTGISLIDPARPGAYDSKDRSTFNPAHPGVINSNALDLAYSVLPIGGTLVLPAGDIPNVGWTVGDGTDTTISTKSGFTIRSKGGLGGVSDGLFGAPRYGTRLLYVGPQDKTHITVRGPLHSSNILMGVLVDNNALASVGVDVIHTYGCNYGFKTINVRAKGLWLRTVPQLFSGVTQGCMDNNFYGFEAIGHALNTAVAVHLQGGEAHNVGCSRNTFWGGRFEIGGAPNTGAIVLEFADNNRFRDVFTHDGANPNTGGKGIWYVKCVSNPIFPCDNFFSGAFIHGDGGFPGTQGNIYSDYATSDGEPLPIGGVYRTSSGLIGGVRRIYVDATNSLSQPGITAALHQQSGVYWLPDGGVGLAANGLIGVEIDGSGRVGIKMSPIAGYAATLDGSLRFNGAQTIAVELGNYLQFQSPVTQYFTIGTLQRFVLDASGFYPAAANSYDIGKGASAQVRNIYSQNPVTVNSDEKLKTEIGDIPDEILKAALEVKWRRYKYKQSVEEKGAKARWHFGVVAQELIETFAKRGIDAFELSLMCLDPDFEIVPVEGEREVEMTIADPDPESETGRKKVTRIEPHTEYERRPIMGPDGKPSSTLSVRYDELQNLVHAARARFAPVVIPE